MVAAAIHLDATLAKDFLAFSRDVKKNSPRWVAKQRDYVAWWADQLAGLDLRASTRSQRTRRTPRQVAVAQGRGPGSTHALPCPWQSLRKALSALVATSTTG